LLYSPLFADLGEATYYAAVAIKANGVPLVQIQVNPQATETGVVNECKLLLGDTYYDIALIPENNGTVPINGETEVLFSRTNRSVTAKFSNGLSVTGTVSLVSFLI